MTQDSAGEYLNRLERGSNWTVLGPKLWWMISINRILRVWPSRTAIDEQVALRRAEMHEDLRIFNARDRLDGDR